MAGEWRDTTPVAESWLYNPVFPAHWKRSPLYALANWVNGLAFRNIQFNSTGKPVIKIAEIKGGITGQTKFTTQTFDESVYITKGDMLFSWSGQPETSIDAFWWHGPDGWLNQHIFKVTPKPGIDRKFFFYLLRYLKPNFVAIARNKQTTGLGHVTKRDLKQINAAFPEEIKEQQAIACILGALDDKIELNRRMNQTLEAMALAIFKSWFVDFEPVVVNAIKAGNPIPEKFAERAAHYCDNPDVPGLAPHVADLFPDAFEESELGEIPKGWRVTYLGDKVDLVKGRSYKSSELVDSDTALVTLKSFSRGGGYRPDGLKPYVGPYKPEQVVQPGELIVACTDVTQAAEVVGRPAIVRGNHHFKTLVASLDTLILRPNGQDITRAFLYFLGGTENFNAHMYAHTTGTTVLHLAKDAVPLFQFAHPGKEIVQVFDRIAARHLHRIDAAATENDILAEFRDTLLPRLISGELRVLDAERIVGRCV